MAHVSLPNIYLSFDVETDGPCVFKNSMRSIGIAAFLDLCTDPIDKFYIHLEPLQDHKADMNTMKNFWQKHPEEWHNINTNTISPIKAMFLLNKWLLQFKGKYAINWVARPSCFDWMWLKNYFEQFGPDDKIDIGYQCIDLSSMFNTYCTIYNIHNRREFQQSLSNNAPYNHKAIDDAVCQGIIYINLRKLLNYKFSYTTVDNRMVHSFF